MPAAQLDEVLRAIELERRETEARLAMVAAVVEQRQQFLSDGHRSMRAYLTAHLNCSGSEANRIRRRGKLLNEHGCAREAVGAGHVSMGNVDLLAKAVAHPRVGDRVGEFVAELVEHGEHFPVKEYQVLVDRVIANADPDGVDPGEDHGANATVAAGPDGVYIKVTGGTALQGVEMKAIFDQAVEAEFAVDVEARRAEHGDRADQFPLPRSAAQRRFAAQYAIHMAYVTVPVGGQRPEPIVDIVFSAGRAGHAMRSHGLVPDDDVFAADDTDTSTDAGADSGWGVEDPTDLFGGRCATSTGVTVNDHDALRAMIRGYVRRVVIDSAGVVIDLGRKRRLFTGSARHAAQLVALSCSHPGCSIPAEFCQVDHLERHTDGGRTDQHNAGPGCGTHNRHKEQARLRSRRATNGRIYLIRPDDTIMLAAGERPPEWAHEPPAIPAPDQPPKAATAQTPREASPEQPPHRASAGPPFSHTISWADYLANGPPVTHPHTWTIIQVNATDLPTRRPPPRND